MCAFILFIYMNFAIDCSILGCLFLFGLATPKAGEIEWLYAWIATYYIFVLDLHMFIYLNGIDASNHWCKYWVSTCLKASKRTMCHTLISFGDLCLMTCNFCLVLVRCLAPIIRQFVKFRDMPENKRKYWCTIRKVPWHTENQMEASLHN